MSQAEAEAMAAASAPVSPESSAAAAVDTTDEDAPPNQQPPPKKRQWTGRRKHSYVARRDEMKTLAVDVETLEKHLQQLKTRESNPRPLTPTQQNAAMKELLKRQQVALWDAHSLLSNRLKAPQLNPLATVIHLTSDPALRRETLLKLCDFKTAEGRRFAIQRSQGLDLMAPFRREDLYLNAEGDYCCDRYDVNQFFGVKSLHQVYEALRFYVFNLEINITEKLGHVTLREDYDVVANRITHQRIVSRDDNNVGHEMNVAMFMQFEERESEGDDGSYGVVTTDYIDQDDLYPYQPEVNMRKDLVATVLLTAHRRKKPKQRRNTVDDLLDGAEAEQEEKEELVVVMRRVIFVKLRRTELEISDSVLQDVRESVARWNDVTVKSMREQLTPHSVGGIHTDI